MLSLPHEATGAPQSRAAVRLAETLLGPGADVSGFAQTVLQEVEAFLLDLLQAQQVRVQALDAPEQRRGPRRPLQARGGHARVALRMRVGLREHVVAGDGETHRPVILSALTYPFPSRQKLIVSPNVIGTT